VTAKAKVPEVELTPEHAAKVTPGPAKWPLHWLLEDMDLYPRHDVDSANARDIADAIRSGAVIPPIVVRTGDGAIIDGYHRRRAFDKVHGPLHLVDVDVREYATDGEAFADAVRLNRAHGRKLNSNDLIKSFERLRGYGFQDGTIETIVRIQVAKVERLSLRVAFRPVPDGPPETVPLKGGDGHLAGRTLRPEDIPILDRRLGVAYGRLARQIIDGAKAGLLPDDEGFWAVMVELHEAVGAAITGRPV
jgi:ParB-like nuclease domain